ncbi:MAG: AraC family transcriptional regulator [Oleiphilaceae bacterium]|nr:AraC family transcriptional regulator [Oleiphilaceae bacterium]
MASVKHSIPRALVDSLLEGARFHQIDLARVLDTDELKELAPVLLERGSEMDRSRVPLDKVGPLLRRLWLSMGDEASGFLSRPLKIGVFSMMCHAIISAGNLRRALLRSARFIGLLTEDVKVELQENGDEARLIIHYRNPHQLDETFFVTSMFVIWIRLSCWLINQPMLLERIHFRFPRPHYDDEFAMMFPCRHAFSQPLNMVVFNRRLLTLPLRQDSESLSTFLNHAPESLLTQFRADNSLTAQVKRLLLHRQAGHTELDILSFEAVSEELHMTTHTLRRRLKDEGNSFQEIKDSIRKGRALVLLEAPDLSLQEIAEQLGFSEPAAFNRAFKKWTGMTPGAYREQLASA